MAQFTYGRKVRDLLLELKRSDWLPVYNDSLVRDVMEEIKALEKEIVDTIELNGQEAMRRDFAVMCGLTVHFESCKRNKKCLIAYLQHRLYKIRALRWETGRVVPENLRHTISRREHDYYDGYDTLLVNYMESVGDNLTADMKPPKELFLQVRALVDCGEVATESGFVTLSRNTTHYLRRSDVEHLIKQGMLEQIEE